MKFLDINSSYSDTGGGIRTFHRAKIAWFGQQHPHREQGGQHRYYLVVPGPRPAVRRVGRRAIRIEVYGIPMGCGYRFMLGYGRVAHLLKRLQPDVVEVGDTLASGPVCLALRRLGWFRGRLTSFYHSDPIETWLVPWAKQGPLRGLRRLATRLLGRMFYGTQRRFDATLVTSQTMHQHLAAEGVEPLARVPLGADPLFFEHPPESCLVMPAQAHRQTVTMQKPASPKIRLLYVGRLIKDKGADLLWDALPKIMSLPGVQLTIVGDGLYHHQFASAGFANLHCLGYVSQRGQLAELYRAHDVLLAPGPYETFGLAVLEAMASGLVVVGPDRGGTAELLAAAKSPHTFRAGDADDFLRAIRRVVSADRQADSTAARQAATRYGTWNDAIARIVAYYERSAAGEIFKQPGTDHWPSVRSRDEHARAA